jgi:hypothetical protein
MPSAKTEGDQWSMNRIAAGTDHSSFLIRDCAPVLIATGLKSYSIRELKDTIAEVHPGSLYHHFWGRLLSPTFDEPEYTNDFAAWAYHEMHDKTTAELLSVPRPKDFDSIETLRLELIDILESRLDESEKIHLAVADQPFHFVRSQLVIFNTGRAVESPEEMAAALREMSSGSIFYHFIEASRRTEARTDDFTTWIREIFTDMELVCSHIESIDPYFSSLSEIRGILAEIFEEHFPPAVSAS